jgi:nitronate monooxygenase
MAGGPTTPELVAAVCNAGAFGMLAAGYRSVEQLADDLAATRQLSSAPFGVNLFARESTAPQLEAAARYRERLVPLAERLGVGVADVANSPGDDHYAAKLDLLVEERVPFVSFTFGLPSADEMARLHDANIAVGITVAGLEDARAALALDPDFLIVQGPEAGGHRGTLDQAAAPDPHSLNRLFAEVLPLARAHGARLIAAGGISTPERARDLLAVGADAVALGTLFLTTHESGTRPRHREALLAGERETVVTRAFSGRNARALRNRFVDEFDLVAPASYPLVHYLTKPIRDASTDNPEYLNLWAGVNYRDCRDESVADLLARFTDLV